MKNERSTFQSIMLLQLCATVSTISVSNQVTRIANSCILSEHRRGSNIPSRPLRHKSFVLDPAGIICNILKAQPQAFVIAKGRESVFGG